MSEQGNVVVFGADTNVVLGQNNAVPAVVAALEVLLAEAKAGELIGIAYAGVSNTGSVGSGWEYSMHSVNLLAGAVMYLFSRFSAKFAEP